MEITIDWQEPIALTSAGRLLDTPERLSAPIGTRKAGVYVFSRKHGDKLYPFYIGQSKMLKARLRSHLKHNVALVKVIEGYGDEAHAVGQGTKFFQYAYLLSNAGVKKKLDIIERALIRKAISDDYVLLNKSNAKIEKHKIISIGTKSFRSIFDKTAIVESK